MPLGLNFVRCNHRVYRTLAVALSRPDLFVPEYGNAYDLWRQSGTNDEYQPGCSRWPYPDHVLAVVELIFSSNDKLALVREPHLQLNRRNSDGKIVTDHQWNANCIRLSEAFKLAEYFTVKNDRGLFCIDPTLVRQPARPWWDFLPIAIDLLKQYGHIQHVLDEVVRDPKFLQHAV